MIKLVKACIIPKRIVESLKGLKAFRQKKNDLGECGTMFGQYGILLFGNNQKISVGNELDVTFK